MRGPRGYWKLLTVLLIALVAGCNSITGVDDLYIDRAAEAPQGGQQGGSSSVTSSTLASSSTGPADGSVSSSSGSPPPPPPPPGLVPVDGATLSAIDVYQALRRPLMKDGNPASSDLPVVAGRRLFLRVFYNTDGSYNGKPITVRLSIDGTSPVEQDVTLGGSSDHLQLGSTINFEVPGELVQVGANYKVELLQSSEESSGSNSAAIYPSQGTASLEAQQGGRTLRVKLVPVIYGGKSPDTSAEQVERYRKWYMEQYPIPNVEVTVRSQAITFNQSLNGYSGWANLLDDITDLRQADNAPNDVYYYGIHMAKGSGLLGLGWVAGSSSVQNRAAIGVGWTGDTSPETAVHELGHNHGRSHSPCGVSGDAQYPHSGAKIGSWGYNTLTKQLLSPNKYVDFMSYCSPTWVSDWTFKALFKRLAVVSTNAEMHIPGHLLNRIYDRYRIVEGVAEFKDSVTRKYPPQGKTKSVTLGPVGGKNKTVSGQYFPYNHIVGGLLYVLKDQSIDAKNTPLHIQFEAEGQTWNIHRK